MNMKKQSAKFIHVLLVLCFLFGFSCNSKQDKEEEPLFIDSPINKEEYFYIESITYECFAIVQNNLIYHIDIVFNI